MGVLGLRSRGEGCRGWGGERGSLGPGGREAGTILLLEHTRCSLSARTKRKSQQRGWGVAGSRRRERCRLPPASQPLPINPCSAGGQREREPAPGAGSPPAHVSAQMPASSFAEGASQSPPHPALPRSFTAGRDASGVWEKLAHQSGRGNALGLPKAAAGGGRGGRVF